MAVAEHVELALVGIARLFSELSGLSQTEVDRAIAEPIRALRSGEVYALGDALGPAYVQLGLAPDSALDTLLMDLARTQETLDGNMSEQLVLECAASCSAFAEYAINHNVRSQAYTFYFSAFGIRNQADHPALNDTDGMFNTANNTDDRAFAAWLRALEYLYRSQDMGAWYSEAIDAVELAICFPNSDRSQQAFFCSRMWDVLESCAGTPLEALIPALLVQTPAYVWDSEHRQRFIDASTESFDIATNELDKSVVREIQAQVKAQNVLDDTRFELRSDEDIRPNLSWHDLTLHHGRLIGAIPLGLELIDNIDRTGEFLLELAHELGHAMVLMGSIGRATTAYRVAAHSCEIFQAGFHKAGDADEPTVEVLQQLPSHPLSWFVARNQLNAVYRSSVLQAVWTPWLEGISLYLELLCDPADHETEILPVHMAIRSLVDFPPIDNEEDAADYRLAVAQRFEGAYSKTIKRLSRLRHIAYSESGEETTVYLAGYLMVRSVVSSWEKTLATRLRPVVAMKLLSDVTRNGTRDALPPLCGDLGDFDSACRERFLDWVTQLAALDRETLEDFLAPVGLDEIPEVRYWKNGRPVRASTDSDGLEHSVRAEYDHLKMAASDLLRGVDIDHLNEVEADYYQIVDQHCPVEHEKELFSIYDTLLPLIPVGLDQARVIFFDDAAARVTICPRTFVGAGRREQISEVPRYRPRSFVLRDGAAEIQSLRHEIAVAATPRVNVTRILDLRGDYFGSLDHAYQSYVCMFLGNWRRVASGDGDPLNDEHDDFVDLIMKCLRGKELFADQSGTLASLDFLAERLLRAVTQDVPRDAPDGIRKLMAACKASARGAMAQDRMRIMCRSAMATLGAAFGCTEDVAERSCTVTLEVASNRHAFVNFLHSSGFQLGGEADDAFATELGQLALDKQAPSGVKAFGGSLND